MREKWQGDYDSHCIYIDDPTLHEGNLRVGWGFGEDKHYYLESISIIIKKIISILSIKTNNTVYFGSSAGGFMSLMLATMHRDTTAVVNNPQFTVKEARYIDFVKSKYPDYSSDEIKKRFEIRFSFYKLTEVQEYFPKIYYIINRYSKADKNLQYIPFQKFVDTHKEFSSKIQFIEYHSPNGHSGLYTREQTSRLLNSILNEWQPDKYTSDSVSNKDVSSSFYVRNKDSDLLSEHKYIDKVYIPKPFFQSNNFAEKTFTFNARSGILKFTILSKYRFKSGRSLLQYSIFKNNSLLATEDMSQFNRPNDINIFNLVQGDHITIKVRTLKNQSSESWTSASTLHFLHIEEYITSIKFPEDITFTSPYMKKIIRP